MRKNSFVGRESAEIISVRVCVLAYIGDRE